MIDDSLLIRMFEYDAQIALDKAELGQHHIRVEFPNSGILLLRGKGNFDSVTVEIVTSRGCVEYPVIVRRMSGLSIDEIFEKHLYMLLPFYIFNLEGKLNLINENGEELEKFSKFYIEIIERLESEMSRGYLSQFSYGVIISLVHKVAYKMTMKREVVRKRVGDIMGGRVLELDIIKAHREGRTEGKSEERADNIRKLAENYMANDASLTKEQAYEMARSILE